MCSSSKIAKSTGDPSAGRAAGVETSPAESTVADTAVVATADSSARAGNQQRQISHKADNRQTMGFPVTTELLDRVRTGLTGRIGRPTFDRASANPIQYICRRTVLPRFASADAKRQHHRASAGGKKEC